MYLCYADESGDAGSYDASKPVKNGSPYLIYTAIIIKDAQWKQSLNILKNFRKQIAREGILPYDQEFHCAELVDPHNNTIYKQISVPERWKLIESFGHVIGIQA